MTYYDRIRNSHDRYAYDSPEDIDYRFDMASIRRDNRIEKELYEYERKKDSVPDSY